MRKDNIMSVPQNEIIKDVLAFIDYDSGGFQIGEVKSHLKNDFPFIQWSLHLIQDTLLSGRFSSRDGYCGVLEQIDSLTPFTLAFSPKGVITQDMCVWVSTAALLGFDVIPYSDLGMKPRIVIVHFHRPPGKPGGLGQNPILRFDLETSLGGMTMS